MTGKERYGFEWMGLWGGSVGSWGRETTIKIHGIRNLIINYKIAT